MKVGAFFARFCRFAFFAEYRYFGLVSAAVLSVCGPSFWRSPGPASGGWRPSRFSRWRCRRPLRGRLVGRQRFFIKIQPTIFNGLFAAVLQWLACRGR